MEHAVDTVKSLPVSGRKKKVNELRVKLLLDLNTSGKQRVNTLRMMKVDVTWREKRPAPSR